MRPFAYTRPSSAEEAAAASDQASADDPKYLGGGTNLVDLMRLGVERPAQLIDVTRLGLDEIERTDDGGLRIGASATNSDTAAHPLVRAEHPLLSQALLAGASGQLRNRATTAGNLLQRTRCVYFQDTTKPCNKRSPGSGCPAIEGEHHNLAIIGRSSSCVATHPSDMAVALTALGAKVHVHVRGASGTRQLSMPGLHRLPGDEPQRDTLLSPGDLITAVTLPPPLPGARARYRKVRERASYAFALVSVAALVVVEDGRITESRIALGGVAHMPWRAVRAEAVLQGAEPSAELFARAAEAELLQAEPLRDNAYKVPMVHNVITQTLTELCA